MLGIKKTQLAGGNLWLFTSVAEDLNSRKSTDKIRDQTRQVVREELEPWTAGL